MSLIGKGLRMMNQQTLDEKRLELEKGKRWGVNNQPELENILSLIEQTTGFNVLRCYLPIPGHPSRGARDAGTLLLYLDREPSFAWGLEISQWADEVYWDSSEKKLTLWWD